MGIGDAVQQRSRNVDQTATPQHPVSQFENLQTDCIAARFLIVTNKAVRLKRAQYVVRGTPMQPRRAGDLARVQRALRSMQRAKDFRGGDNGLTFLAWGTREPNDICWYPRSQKMMWRGVGVIGRVEQLDYWDGEEPD